MSDGDKLTFEVRPSGPPRPEYLPDHVQILTLAAGKWVSQPLYVIAELGVADELADGPRSVDDLAARLDCRPDPLARCLRAVAMFGIVTESTPGTFALTSKGHYLRSGVAQSVRDFTILMGQPAMWASFGEILSTVRTGAPAFAVANGTTLNSTLALDPGLLAAYEGAWAALTDELADESLDRFGLSRFTSVADLGGGHGRLLVAMLRSAPSLRGVLLDEPAVLSAASGPLLASDVADRLSLVSGRLPTDVPHGSDCYLLKNTLHCFDDDLALAVLRQVRGAIGANADARLLIVETVVPVGDAFDWSKLIDIEVMVNNGGRERSADQWVTLLDAAGFDVERVVPLTPPQHLIEGRPR